MRWIYTRDAEGVDRLMDPFLRRLAHDLRGHAGIVSSSLEQAKEPGAPLETLLPLAARGAQKMLRLSEKIALFSEIQRLGAVVVRAPTDMALLVDDVVKKVNEASNRKSIVLGKTVPEMPHLPVDGRLLGAAMVELGLNAVRFAKSQAHLTLEASPTGLLVRFQDDGPGFPESFDVDAPTTTNGLGVSLPIAAAIARGHGGELTAKTHKGGRVELRIVAA